MVTFHAIGRSDLTIMVDESGMTTISEHTVGALSLLFNHVFYIYPRMYCMILITWFQVWCTKFLPPLFKSTSGLLAMTSIALLVIIWFTTLKTPFSRREPQFYCQDYERRTQSTWHSPLMFRCSCIFCFH